MSEVKRRSCLMMDDLQSGAKTIEYYLASDYDALQSQVDALRADAEKWRAMQRPAHDVEQFYQPDATGLVQDLRTSPLTAASLGSLPATGGCGSKGHKDPDNTGQCIHCGVVLGE
jgi:hypothetical protein